MMSKDCDILMLILQRFKNCSAGYRLCSEIERTLMDHTCIDAGIRHDSLKKLFVWINKNFSVLNADLKVDDIKNLQILTYCVMKGEYFNVVPFLGKFQKETYEEPVVSDLCSKIQDLLINSVVVNTCTHRANLLELQDWLKDNFSSLSSVIGESNGRDWENLVLLMMGERYKVSISSLQRTHASSSSSDLLWLLTLRTRAYLEDVDMAYKSGGNDAIIKLIKLLEKYKIYDSAQIVARDAKSRYPDVTPVAEGVLMRLADKCMFYAICWAEEKAADEAIDLICQHLGTNVLYMASIVTGPNGEDWLSDIIKGKVILNSVDSFRESLSEGDDPDESIWRLPGNGDDKRSKSIESSAFIRSMSMSKDGATNRSSQIEGVRAIIKVDVRVFLRAFFATLRDMKESRKGIHGLYWSEFVDDVWEKHYLNGKDALNFAVVFGRIEYTTAKSAATLDVLVKNDKFIEDEEVRLALFITMHPAQPLRWVSVDNNVLSIRMVNDPDCFECIGYASHGNSFETLEAARAHENACKFNNPPP